MSEYVTTEIDETDIGSIVILDGKHKVCLVSVKVIFATVRSGTVEWQVVKNRLKRRKAR